MEYENEILINDIKSYPEELTRFLNSCENDLSNFIKEEKRLDNLEANIDSYSNPTKNKFQENWNLNIRKIEEILKRNSFIGFHCTRLTNKEVGIISKNGLVPLSTQLVKEKLERILNDKLLSKETFEFLLKNNSSNQNNRTGKIWFLHDKRILRNSNSVGRLFKNWGGESIYNNHEENKIIKSEITKIGKPVILVCSFKFEELNPFKSLAEYISKIWINRNSKEYFVNLFDTKITKKKKIKKVIRFEDKLFKELTEFENWKINLN